MNAKRRVSAPSMRCKCGKTVFTNFIAAEDEGRIRIAGKKCECGAYYRVMCSGKKYQEEI